MIKIVTDSSSLLTIEDGRAMGVESIPLCVCIETCNYRDLQVDMKLFYDQIKAGGIPTSSQPPIGDILEIYEQYKGSQIINITMADGLSGTYQTAMAAREMMDHKNDITVVNSETLCGPHRYMVEEAKQMVDEGESLESILEFLEEAKQNTGSFLIPQNFAFLKRGGRLTPMAAAFGGLLKLKPIMIQTEDGKRLDKFGVGRTMTAAIDSIIKRLKRENIGGNHMIYISHADACEDAQKIKCMLEADFPNLEIRLMELSSAFVTQGGPQCVAIQYIKKRQI